ncbi:MAG TPA: hypothetical protein VNL18_05555, partial [Gemmatimonadales bacterium]|nr:hypothetical protein [Gemmatimonadales bacterium]
GRAAAAIRGIEAEMRHLWDLCHGDPQPAIQERLERLRNERAALAEQKHNAQRTSEEAGLRLARARRAIDAAEERARRLRRQLRQENDEARRVRRAIAVAEQSLARQRDMLQVREALLNSLREELRDLTGEILG